MYCRIGRTGRLGNTGRAISFYDAASDCGIAADLVKILADAQQVQYSTVQYVNAQFIRHLTNDCVHSKEAVVIHSTISP